MKVLMSKKVGIRTIISGATLAAIGFVLSMLDVFNVYSKASSCIGNSECNVSKNLSIAHIEAVAFFSGLVLVVLGCMVIVANSNRNK